MPESTPPERAPRAVREDRRKAYARGHSAETVAAVFLMFKGYRILARRYKTPLGEIDLIARRGGRVAFVEVKQRPTQELCEAAITSDTRRRVRRAAQWWMSRNPRFQEFDQGFDVVFVMRGRLPKHLPNAL